MQKNKVIIGLCSILLFSSCGNSAGSKDEDYIDLTLLNENMAYAQVTNMVNNPEVYHGVKIKTDGIFTFADVDGTIYYSVFINDTAGCCSQGLDFECKENSSLENQLQIGEEITVEGYFDSYTEGDTVFCCLRDSTLKVKN